MKIRHDRRAIADVDADADADADADVDADADAVSVPMSIATRAANPDCGDASCRPEYVEREH